MSEFTDAIWQFDVVHQYSCQGTVMTVALATETYHKHVLHLCICWATT